MKQEEKQCQSKIKISKTQQELELEISSSIKSISIPSKLKSLLIEDYYNSNTLKKYSSLPGLFTINDILQKYIKSKDAKLNLLKKNNLLNKINPNFKLISSSFDEIFNSLEFDIQMIYINDIINSLKEYMIKTVSSIVYSEDELIYINNIIYNNERNDSKRGDVLDILGVIHFIRYIIQIFPLVKVFFNGCSFPNDTNFKIYYCILDDLLGFLDKII